jgi:UDP-N-acetylmuramate dehydrogenase
VQRFKGKVFFDVPMSEYTSIGIGGVADVMAFPKDEADLADILGFAKTKKYPVFVLGAGTNLLVRDGGIRGIVVNMAEGFKEILWQDDEESVRAVVGAGLGLGRLVKICTEKGLTGMEFAEGIPGTVGGAATMNAGAFGGDMSEVTGGVEVVETAGRKIGKKSFISKSELGLDYRSSRLPKASIIVRVHMRFKRRGTEEIKKKVDELRAKRKKAAPIRRPNAGSIFKNPPGEVAGRLIDEAGLKGYCVGDAEISELHGNYIVNKGRATARDVLSLMAMMRDKVYKVKGINLEPEIKVVGED